MTGAFAMSDMTAIEQARRGLELQAAGNLAEAAAEFDAALALDPNCAEAHNGRGIIHYLCNEFSEAISAFDRALAANPGYAQALNNRGMTRRTQGDLPGALADFESALGADPTYADALGNRGLARRSLGDLPGALADFDQAVKLASAGSAAACYHNRATARQQLGDLEGALADFEQAIALASPSEAARFVHGRVSVHVARLDFASAVADCDEAIRLDPYFTLAYISRAHARYHRRDAKSFIDYLRAIELNPEVGAREIARAAALHARDDGEGVLANCSKHLRINPADVTALVRRGLTLLLMGREAEAWVDFEAAVEQAPRFRRHLEVIVDAAQQFRDAGPPVEVGGTNAELYPATERRVGLREALAARRSPPPLNGVFVG